MFDSLLCLYSLKFKQSTFDYEILLMYFTVRSKWRINVFNSFRVQVISNGFESWFDVNGASMNFWYYHPRMKKRIRNNLNTRTYFNRFFILSFKFIHLVCIVISRGCFVYVRAWVRAHQCKVASMEILLLILNLVDSTHFHKVTIQKQRNNKT